MAAKGEDHGLSVERATCDAVVSSTPDYGDIFAWGDTSPKHDYTAYITRGV